MLQEGGEHEAKRVAPPVFDRAVALLEFEAVVVTLLKAATSGFVVLHVRGAGFNSKPRVSTTVAVIGIYPPVLTVVEFPAPA